jgi:hypothetical protein
MLGLAASRQPSLTQLSYGRFVTSLDRSCHLLLAALRAAQYSRQLFKLWPNDKGAKDTSKP